MLCPMRRALGGRRWPLRPRVLLYRSTLLPGFDFGDTASFQTVVGSHCPAARCALVLCDRRGSSGSSAAIPRTR